LFFSLFYKAGIFKNNFFSTEPKFVVVGDMSFPLFPFIGIIFTSDNGKKWTKQNLEIYKPLMSVIYAKHTFVVVGANGIILQSNHMK
jgi:hypothetical protein